MQSGRLISGFPALVAALTLLPACAAYEHRLIEPSEFAATIGDDILAFSIEPLEYEAASRSGQLQLRIVNPTNDEIALIGERSYLIDPSGESRAIRGGVIAPRSHITLALPPEPRIGRAGPRLGVGIGVGAGFSRYGHIGAGAYDPWYGRPAYTTVTDEASSWRWETGPVRLRLHFDRAGETFQHDLAFERVRVQ